MGERLLQHLDALRWLFLWDQTLLAEKLVEVIQRDLVLEEEGVVADAQLREVGSLR